MKQVRPKKNLGQHFLTDLNIAKAIADTVDACPDLPYDLVTPEYLFYDLIYNPGETCFLRRATERGATTKNGLEMLHLQAEASWDFWHNDD